MFGNLAPLAPKLLNARTTLRWCHPARCAFERGAGVAPIGPGGELDGLAVGATFALGSESYGSRDGAADLQQALALEGALHVVDIVGAVALPADDVPDSAGHGGDHGAGAPELHGTEVGSLQRGFFTHFNINPYRGTRAACR